VDGVLLFRQKHPLALTCEFVFRVPRKLTVPFVFRFYRAKLDHSVSIRNLDFHSIRAVVFIDVFSSHHGFPRSPENEIVVAMFHDED